MPYCHPKESAHAQDAREAREKALGLEDQSTLRLGYYDEPATERNEFAHSDDLAVDRFATAMKAKLAKKREEGRGGWDDKDQCSGDLLSILLREHVEKGDPLDIGNLAMMLHQRGERISAALTAPVRAAGVKNASTTIPVADPS